VIIFPHVIFDPTEPYNWRPTPGRTLREEKRSQPQDSGVSPSTATQKKKTPKFRQLRGIKRKWPSPRNNWINSSIASRWVGNNLPTALLDSMDRETEKSIANRKIFPTRMRYSASHYYYKAHRIPGGQVSRAPSPRGPML
jgi:hypothetical protein